MRLKIDLSDSYPWPVTVKEAGGLFEFSAKFRRLPRSRVDELMDRLRDREVTVTDRQLLAEVWCGWDVQDLNGNPAPFDDESLAEIREVLHNIDACTALAWIDSVTTGPLKN